MITQISDNFYKEAIVRCLMAINSPYSIMAFYCLIDSDIGSLRAPAPSQYSEPLDYFRDAQVYSLFSKNTFFSDKALDEAVVDSFLRSETLCLETNTKLRGDNKVGFTDPTIVLARRWCSYIMGSNPSFEKPSVPHYGPGSTTTHNGIHANVVSKISRQTEVTPGCYPLWNHLFSQNSIGTFKFTRTSKYSFVPKNFKSHRSICIEPGGNLQVQKYLGKQLRSRLSKSLGVVLENVQSKHHNLVRTRFSEISTIDLKAASDTISFETVKLLVPSLWFDALVKARTPSTLLPDGTIHELQKFSANGNGYTFELETILFMSIVLATIGVSPSRESFDSVRELVSVYGDDIIVPHTYAQDVIKNLESFGFQTNLEKTFVDSDFVESCGKDYFKGVDVRPLHLRGKPNGTPESFFTMVNQIRRILNRISPYFSDNPRSLPGLSYILNGLPKRNLRFGPHCELYEDLWIETDDISEYLIRHTDGITKLESLTSIARRFKIPRQRTYVDGESILVYASLLGDSHGPSIRGPIACIRKIQYSIS